MFWLLTSKKQKQPRHFPILFCYPQVLEWQTFIKQKCTKEPTLSNVPITFFPLSTLVDKVHKKRSQKERDCVWYDQWKEDQPKRLTLTHHKTVLEGQMEWNHYIYWKQGQHCFNWSQQ